MIEMRLGNRVTSKKTGLPMTGQVVGFVWPLVMAIQNNIPLRELKNRSTRWTEIYPDWDQKVLVYVFVDEPIYHMSYEEYKTHFKDGTPEHYQETVPKVQLISYPIDDLEEIENDEDQCGNSPEETTSPATDS